MRLLLAAATALVLIPAAANAAEWYRFYRGTDVTHYIDTETIRPNGQWTGVEQYSVYDATAEDGMKAVRAVMAFDCGRRMFRVLTFTTYRADGTTIRVLEDPGRGKEYRSSPGSPAEIMSSFVCDNQRTGPRVEDPNKDPL